MQKDPQNTKGPEGPIARSDLSARLKALEECYSSRAEALRTYGRAKTTYDKWLYEKSSPSLESIAKIAKVAGVSLDWLAFGEGQGLGGSKATSAAKCEADSTLMSEIYLKIHGLVRDHDQRLSPDQHIAFACDVYNKVMSKPDDREDIVADALGLMAIMLKGLNPPEPAEQTPAIKRRA